MMFRDKSEVLNAPEGFHSSEKVEKYWYIRFY